MTRRDSLLFLGGLVTLAGCGGGGSGMVTPVVRVNWPALSRTVDPSSHARSITVRIVPKTAYPGATVQEIVIQGDRLRDEAHVAEYKATQSVLIETVEVTVSVHADVNGTGRQLQTNKVEVVPGSDGVLPEIVLIPGSGHVLSIVLPSIEVLTVGEQAALTPLVQFVSGVPFIFAGVPEREVKWEMVSYTPEGEPVARIDYNGPVSASYRITGLRKGNAQLWMHIDDAISNPIGVSVVE